MLITSLSAFLLCLAVPHHRGVLPSTSARFARHAGHGQFQEMIIEALSYPIAQKMCAGLLDHAYAVSY